MTETIEPVVDIDNSPEVPTIAITNFGYGVIGNYYLQLPAFLTDQCVQAIIPMDPDTGTSWYTPDAIADALEQLAEYVREGGLLPSLDGVERLDE